MNGNTYNIIFCCCAIILFYGSTFGIPFTINWRWVVNVVADINAMRQTVTILVPVVALWLRKLSAMGALRNFASCAVVKSFTVNIFGTYEVLCAIPLSTLNSAKKIGACASSGRHGASGLVLCSL